MPDAVFPGNPAVNPAFPGIRRQNTAEDFNGGAFAGSVRPYVTYHFSVLNGKGNIVQSTDPFIFPVEQAVKGMEKAGVTPCHAVGFGNMGYFDHGKNSPLSRSINARSIRWNKNVWEQIDTVSEGLEKGLRSKKQGNPCIKNGERLLAAQRHCLKTKDTARIYKKKQ